MDVLEFLNSLDEGSTQLVFADPPYNIKKAEWDSFESQQKYIEWCMEWIKACHRVLNDSGSLFVCGFSEILADIKYSANKIFKGCKWLVWYYRNKGNLGNDWGRSHESILHFRKSKKFKFHIDEVRIPYNAHTIKYPVRPQAKSSQYNNKKNYIWSPHPKGAKPKDVFEIPTIANGSWEKTRHITQKPIELLKKIILSSTDPGDLIIDPFGGSGTTYIVAEAFGRSWKGCEINKGYCKIIKDRFSLQNIKRIREGKDEIQSLERRVKIRG